MLKIAIFKFVSVLDDDLVESKQIFGPGNVSFASLLKDQRAPF